MARARIEAGRFRVEACVKVFNQHLMDPKIPSLNNILDFVQFGNRCPNQ